MARKIGGKFPEFIWKLTLDVVFFVLGHLQLFILLGLAWSLWHVADSISEKVKEAEKMPASMEAISKSTPCQKMMAEQMLKNGVLVTGEQLRDFGRTCAAPSQSAQAQVDALKLNRKSSDQ